MLLLNGDQSKQLIQEQLQEIDMPRNAPVVIQQGWQLKRYNEFCKLIDKHKPAMVVIDSLIGCSSGDAFDENKIRIRCAALLAEQKQRRVVPAHHDHHHSPRQQDGWIPWHQRHQRCSGRNLGD